MYSTDQGGMCIFHRTLDLVRFYSCIPIYDFEISPRCASADDILDCARKPAELAEEVDSYSAMVKAGLLEKIQAAQDYIIILDGDRCASHAGRIGGKQVTTIFSIFKTHLQPYNNKFYDI